MPHDPAFLLAEKIIEEALKSDATEFTSRYLFIRFAKQPVDHKGNNNGT